MRLRRPSNRVLAIGTAGILALAAVGVFVVLSGGGPQIVIPDRPCASPPPLRTYQGVTLQPIAMRAFKRAERKAGGPIEVVQSYRSCAQQAIACKGICGNMQGCPGRCVKPGTSYHQLGAAVDISDSALANTRIVGALKAAGWCEPLPSSDPGHFSFGGCH